MTEKYEITYLLEEGKVVDVKKTLLDAQAQIEKETDLGVRQLAYPINKITRAHYAAIRFDLEPTELVKLEKTLRQNKEIVRYLCVKNPPEAPVKTIKASKVEIKEAPKPAEKPQAKSEEKTEATLAKGEEPKVEVIETEVSGKDTADQGVATPSEKVEIVETKTEPAEKPTKEIAPAPEVKEAKPAKVEKVAKPKPKAKKAEKIEADKLDEKLKELTLD